MEDKYIKGTPSMIMLPAKNYVFKINEEHYEIRLPMKGNYHDLAPDFFPEDAGEFNIFDEEHKLIFLSSINKVLFATKQYPDMKFNQFFIPSILKFEKDEVILIGQVMDMMLATKSEEPQIEGEQI